MSLISNCPVCLAVPRISYCFGEYFVLGSPSCPYCGRFNDMHSSYLLEVSSWNNYCFSLANSLNGVDSL